MFDASPWDRDGIKNTTILPLPGRRSKKPNRSVAVVVHHFNFLGIIATKKHKSKKKKKSFGTMQKRLYFQRRILASSIGSTLRLTTQGMWNCRESHAILGRNWMAGVAVGCCFCSRQIIPPGMYKNNSRVHFSTLQRSPQNRMSGTTMD